MCNRGRGERGSGPQTPAAKYLYWPIFKKSRHLGFGVFIDIWSMGKRLHAFEVLLGITFEQILPQVDPANLSSSFVRSIDGRRKVESISA